MQARRIFTTTLLAAAAAVAFGCQEGTGPTEIRATHGPTLSKSGAGVDAPITVFKRTTPLAGDVSASREIGPSGGTIDLKEAGVKLVFPRGAVAAPVTITVRALAGEFVVFTCEPHGTVFATPARAEVKLKGTTAWKNESVQESLEGAYIDGPWSVGPDGRATAYQELAAIVDVTNGKAIFGVPHFSTLALASGEVRR